MNAAILLTLIGAHIPLAVQIVAERRPAGGSSFTVRIPVEACAGLGRK